MAARRRKLVSGGLDRVGRRAEHAVQASGLSGAFPHDPLHEPVHHNPVRVNGGLNEFTIERDAVTHVAAHAAGGAHFHDLRDVAGSDSVPVNVVRAVMGHESTSTTLNLYTHAPSEYHDLVRGVFDDPADDSLTPED
jgi:integrase